ncbi:hypothetical protein ACHAPT_008694 [Fusarium lateritium]
MKSQLCQKCQSVFADDAPLTAYLRHHQSRESILAAVADGCRLCSQIVKTSKFANLDSSMPFITTGNIWKTPSESSSPTSSVKLDIWLHPSRRSEDYQSIDEACEAQDAVQDDEEVVIPQSGRDVVFEPGDGPGGGLESWTFIFVPEADIPPQYMQREPLAGTGGVDEMWSLARSWLQECCQSHEDCSAPQSPSFYPTRLVEILDKANIRIIECSSSTNKPLQRYAAFSHCWGQAETLKLLKDNIARLERRIDISELPQSYKEALDACLRLDIKYIWIDSLCIIQDSTDDWRAESATMMHVYGNALLTIAASSAAESSMCSFLHRDPLCIPPASIMVPQEGQGDMPDIPYILVPDKPFQEIRNSPLRRRAWVLQESYISNRILFLADTQLWWECRETLRCESWPAGIPKETLDQGMGHQEANDIHSRWYDLVQEYSRCTMTNFSDKLIAMAGLANHLQPSIGNNDEYIAGFWRSQLPHALCWGKMSKPVQGFRPAQYRAPSWSWASLEGVEFLRRFDSNHSITDACQILDIRLVHAGANPYGDLKGGYMLLRGRLFPVKAEKNFANHFQRLKLPGYTPSPRSALYARWDEAVLGETVISHLDTSDVDLLRDASLTSAKRVTKIAKRWEGDLFYLPVSEFSSDGEPKVVLKGSLMTGTRD